MICNVIWFVKVRTAFWWLKMCTAIWLVKTSIGNWYVRICVAIRMVKIYNAIWLVKTCTVIWVILCHFSSLLFQKILTNLNICNDVFLSHLITLLSTLLFEGLFENLFQNIPRESVQPPPPNLFFFIGWFDMEWLIWLDSILVYTLESMYVIPSEWPAKTPTGTGCSSLRVRLSHTCKENRQTHFKKRERVVA